MIKRHLFLGFLALAVSFTTISCNKDPDVSSFGIDVGLKDLTPLYKGTSEHFGNRTEDVILYATKAEGLYYIHQFFGEDGGGIGFNWDRKTNKITVEESFTGLLGEGGPVYILSQGKYLLNAGEDALDSFFSPSTGIFSFYVVMETADALGQPVQFTTVLNYTINTTL